MTRLTLLILLLLSNVCNGMESTLEVFEKFWHEAKPIIYPKDLEQRYFTDLNYQQLREKASTSASIDDLAVVLNEFLGQFGVSHTYFYTPSELDYYVLKSMFSYRDIGQPELHHIGVQVAGDGNQFVVRNVLERYPAQQSGLRRGDIIMQVDGNAYRPVWSFNANNQNTGNQSRQYTLRYSRNGIEFQTNITPVYESMHESFRNATLNSVRKFEQDGKSIGYIHFWTGTLPDSDALLKQLVTQNLAESDGIILDLRDGFGGAFWEHLDTFFPNRQNFFTATWLGRDGDESPIEPPQQVNDVYYAGPLVVLINEGVRSGKELMSYQFKKSNRAILVGTNTAGSVVGGRGLLLQEENPYLLYLSSIGLKVDDINLEGVGVKPEVEVFYPLSESLEVDPQLNEARSILQGLMEQAIQ